MVVLLFCFVPGQSGTVIATVLPTLAGRHNSTLIIIQNSGCLRELRFNRLSPTCSGGNTANNFSFFFSTDVYITEHNNLTIRNIRYAPSAMINDDRRSIIFSGSKRFRQFFFFLFYCLVCCKQPAHHNRSFFRNERFVCSQNTENRSPIIIN